MRPSSAGAAPGDPLPTSPSRPVSATFSFDKARTSIFETHIDSAAYLLARERRKSIADKRANRKNSFTHVDFKPVGDLALAAKLREEKAREKCRESVHAHTHDT